MRLSTSRRWLLLSSAGLLAVLAGGCASTATLSRFDAFAQAGAQYVQATDPLLTQAGQIKLDASSEELLRLRAVAPVSRDNFLARDKADRGYLDELSLLRRQVDLLGEYFSALDALATSKTPEAFGSTMATTATTLGTLGQELRGGTIAQAPAAVQALASGVGSLVVVAAESRALERELEARKETIAAVLLLQEAMLGAIRDQVSASLQATARRQYDEQVITPYETPDTTLDPTTWKQDRQQGLEPPDPVVQLTAAEGAARNLRLAWTKLISHQLGPDDINAVTSELQPILAALDSL